MYFKDIKYFSVNQNKSGTIVNKSILMVIGQSFVFPHFHVDHASLKLGQGSFSSFLDKNLFQDLS